MTRIRPPKPVNIGGRPHTPPKHLVKPTTGGNSDLDKLRANRPNVPPVIKPKPWGHPPPPPKPKRPHPHPASKQFREERDRMARRDPKRGNQWFSPNDLKAEALQKKQLELQRLQQQQQLNPPSTPFGDTTKSKDDTHRHSARCRDKRGNIIKDCMTRLNREGDVRGKGNLPF